MTWCTFQADPLAYLCDFIARQRAQACRARYCHIICVSPFNVGIVSKRLYTSNFYHGCLGPSQVPLTDGDESLIIFNTRI